MDAGIPPNSESSSSDSPRALAGASLQKAWLISPTLLALQLRTPGRSSILLVDAERALALIARDRPASPEPALKAQATLRAAIEGARLDAIERVLPRDALEGSKQISLRIALTTTKGPRTLIADPRARALVLAAEEKIVWTAPGAAATHRPGAGLPPWKPAPESVAAPMIHGNVNDLHRNDSETEALLAAREAEKFRSEKQARLRAAKSAVQKLERTLGAIERDLATARSSIDSRRAAELLLPMQSKIPRGAREARVPDWSRLGEDGQPEQLVIALDPALGAAENASRMLKKAQRYAAALPRIEARRDEIARGLENAKESLRAIEAAPDLRSLQTGAGASIARGRAQSGPERSHKKQERLPFRAFRASNGARILVGRSAKDNDALTLRWARGDDLWLHARGVQGSHVIFVDPGTAPDSRALGEAALLAAHFSSARGADGAEVSWTRRKYVRKGKQQAPGAVTFSQEKSIRVRLDEALLEALLAREEK